MIALLSYSCKDPLEMDDYKQTRYINEKRIIYVTAWNKELSQPDIYMIDWDSTSMVLVAENSFAIASTAQRQLPVLSKPIIQNTINNSIFSFFNVSSTLLTNKLQIGTGPQRFYYAAISPDRRSIAISSATDAGRLSIIDLATGNTTEISTKAIPESRPKFSLSGRFLAFIQNGGGIDSIMVYETETGKLRPIGALNAYRNVDLAALDWSYDSKEVIAIGAASGGYSKLYGFRTDSSITREIYSEANQMLCASYSPDGSQIAIATADATYLISPQGLVLSGLPSKQISGTIGKQIEWETGGKKMIILHMSGNSGGAFQTGTLEFIDLVSKSSSVPVQTSTIINFFFPTISMD